MLRFCIFNLYITVYSVMLGMFWSCMLLSSLKVAGTELFWELSLKTNIQNKSNNNNKKNRQAETEATVCCQEVALMKN